MDKYLFTYPMSHSALQASLPAQHKRQYGSYAPSGDDPLEHLVETAYHHRRAHEKAYHKIVNDWIHDGDPILAQGGSVSYHGLPAGISTWIPEIMEGTIPRGLTESIREGARTEPAPPAISGTEVINRHALNTNRAGVVDWRTFDYRGTFAPSSMDVYQDVENEIEKPYLTDPYTY